MKEYRIGMTYNEHGITWEYVEAESDEESFIKAREKLKQSMDENLDIEDIWIEK